MAKKYPAMRTAASIFRVLGWMAMVLGVISSVGWGIYTRGWEGGVLAFVGIMYSIVAGVFLLATADLFYCLIDIETNTRSGDKATSS
ncbi:MAG: hypothetical protein AB1603_04430 [Chloroflexota bacterium]